MTYTAYTAFIVTLHNLSAILSLIIALIMSAVSYWIFVKGRKNRLLIATLTFVASLIVGALLSEEVFQRAPISLEMVQAG